jgi:hypothetical protein
MFMRRIETTVTKSSKRGYASFIIITRTSTLINQFKPNSGK